MWGDGSVVKNILSSCKKKNLSLVLKLGGRQQSLTPVLGPTDELSPPWASAHT